MAGREAPCEPVGRSAGRVSHCQPRLSALLNRTGKRKTLREIVGDQESSDRAACHRELPGPSARQGKRITRACYDARTLGPVMSSDDESDLGARSDCPTSGKERTAVAPDSPNRLSTKPSSPTASASISCVPRPGIQALSTAPSLLTMQRTRPSDSARPTDISPDVDPRA